MSIPDFTDREIWFIENALKERYGHSVEVQRADVELRLDPALPQLAVCPAAVWKERGAAFVVSKVDDNRFRGQFFYSVREQYGTGRQEYDDLSDLVTTLLKLQSDHEAKREQA